jgi:hypothetical protein
MTVLTSHDATPVLLESHGNVAHVGSRETQPNRLLHQMLW